MSDRNPDVRKPVDTSENYRMAFRLFALLGVGLIGVAVYFYFYLTQAEARGEIIVWWRGYDQLYEAYGKWGVVALHVVGAVVCFVASGFAFRSMRRMERWEKEHLKKQESAEGE